MEILGVNVSDFLSGIGVIGCFGKLSWDVVKEWRKGSYAEYSLKKKGKVNDSCVFRWNQVRSSKWRMDSGKRLTIEPST